MVHGGVCLAEADDGTPVMVENAIPGETVEAALRFRKGRTWFARVVRVHEPSPLRVSPPCPYVPECGGCQLQHVTYDGQLQLKREIVLDALRRQHVQLPDVVNVHPAPGAFEYRWRGEFHVVPGAEGASDASLGFNRARSWTPIAVDDCLIHHRAIRSRLGALRDLVRAGGAESLRVLHVTAGAGGDELLVRGKPEAALDRTAVDRASLALDGGRLSTDATTLEWRGHVFRATPQTFIQVNWEQMETLYACAVAALGDVSGQLLVDAYAGIGVLPVELAKTARQVLCIESNPAAARAGVHNARVNGVVERIEYIPRAAEDALPSLGHADIAAVILDPPRAGCAGAVTGWLALAGPPRVVYISCDPATLARDLHVLAVSGPYRVRSLDVVDMFPQTYHVECVVALTRESVRCSGPVPLPSST